MSEASDYDFKCMICEKPINIHKGDKLIIREVPRYTQGLLRVIPRGTIGLILCKECDEKYDTLYVYQGKIEKIERENVNED